MTICAKPVTGWGMNLPNWSVASKGILSTSASVSSMPSMARACALTSAQVARPPSAPSSRLPVATGRPCAFRAYSRRKTWCEACEV
ncbi:hypothetical protein D3C78_1550430 [compost metagenome]